MEKKMIQFDEMVDGSLKWYLKNYINQEIDFPLRDQK